MIQLLKANNSDNEEDPFQGLVEAEKVRTLQIFTEKYL
jgi:hypothetical protein